MAECQSPVQLVRDRENIYVPCGKCAPCCARRTSNWSFRLMQEERWATSCWFLTLTYAPQHVKRSPNGFKTLCKRDVQLFFKRLRKAHGKSKIKYFVAGEYGSQTRRPHYHIILYNANIKLIDAAWNLGSIFYGSVTGASVGYTLKYISKDKSGRLHNRDDREPEFQLQSKGLGACYLTPAMVRWHRADLIERMYCYSYDGKKVSMPRYYKSKIYSATERVWVSAMAHENVQKRNDEILAKRRAANPNYERDYGEAMAALERNRLIKSKSKTYI